MGHPRGRVCAGSVERYKTRVVGDIKNCGSHRRRDRRERESLKPVDDSVSWCSRGDRVQNMRGVQSTFCRKSAGFDCGDGVEKVDRRGRNWTGGNDTQVIQNVDGGE